MLVNYISENQARIEYAINEGLSSSEWLLWEALYYLFNLRAKASDWPDGFIRIPNKRLLSVIPVQYDAMASARNKLKQRGVIDYVQGKKNTDPPMYKLNYLTVPQVVPDVQSVDNSVDNSCYPFKPDNLPDNLPGNPPGNLPGNPPGKTANIYPNVTPKDVYKLRKEEEEEERAREGAPLASEDLDASAKLKAMKRTVANAIRKQFGEPGTPGCVSRIALMLTSLDFSEEMATLLIEQAALCQAKDIFAFSARVLQDWVDDEITTPEEYAERRLLLDLQAGRVDGIHHNVTAELQDQRRRRISDHRNGIK